MNEREWGWVRSQSTRSRSIMTTLGVLITLFVTLFLAVNNLPETSTLLKINEKTLQITDIGLTWGYPQSNSGRVLLGMDI